MAVPGSYITGTLAHFEEAYPAPNVARATRRVQAPGVRHKP